MEVIGAQGVNNIGQFPGVYPSLSDQIEMQAIIWASFIDCREFQDTGKIPGTSKESVLEDYQFSLNVLRQVTEKRLIEAGLPVKPLFKAIKEIISRAEKLAAATEKINRGE